MDPCHLTRVYAQTDAQTSVGHDVDEVMGYVSLLNTLRLVTLHLAHLTTKLEEWAEEMYVPVVGFSVLNVSSGPRVRARCVRVTDLSVCRSLCHWLLSHTGCLPLLVGFLGGH